MRAASAPMSHGMVHRFDQKAVQFEKIAGKQEGQDLPPPISQNAVAASQTADHDKGPARRIAFVAQVHPGAKSLLVRAERLKDTDFSRGQGHKASQLRDE